MTDKNYVNREIVYRSQEVVILLLKEHLGYCVQF